MVVSEAATSELPGEPAQFRLGEHLFTLRDPVPFGALVVFGRAGNSTFDQLKAIDRLLRSWIVPEQADEWDEALSAVTSFQQIADLAVEVVESVTARPTSAPSSAPG